MELAGLHAVQSITVRADLKPLGADIADGTGTEGDIVLARVVDPGGVAALVDWREHRNPVKAGTVLLGVLAHRDSTTHASGGLPSSGIPISAGTRLAWLGGRADCSESRPGRHPRTAPPERKPPRPWRRSAC